MKDEEKYSSVADMANEDDTVNPFRVRIHLLECESEAKDLKIKDLEAKLAESEEAIKYLKGIKRYDIGEMLTENTKLKQQLADITDKYKFLEEYTNISDRARTSVEKQLAEKEKELYLTKDTLKHHINIYNSLFESRTQDKISFAVEQLEQVRKLVDELLDNCGDRQYKVWKIFDNQIEELKKETK